MIRLIFKLNIYKITLNRINYKNRLFRLSQKCSFRLKSSHHIFLPMSLDLIINEIFLKNYKFIKKLKLKL